MAGATLCLGVLSGSSHVTNNRIWANVSVPLIRLLFKLSLAAVSGPSEPEPGPGGKRDDRLYSHPLQFWTDKSKLSHAKEDILQSNLVIRNILFALKVFLNAKSS